jgi:hypothetical protein
VACGVGGEGEHDRGVAAQLRDGLLELLLQLEGGHSPAWMGGEVVEGGGGGAGAGLVGGAVGVGEGLEEVAVALEREVGIEDEALGLGHDAEVFDCAGEGGGDGARDDGAPGGVEDGRAPENAGDALEVPLCFEALDGALEVGGGEEGGGGGLAGPCGLPGFDDELLELARERLCCVGGGEDVDELLEPGGAVERVALEQRERLAGARQVIAERAVLHALLELLEGVGAGLLEHLGEDLGEGVAFLGGGVDVGDHRDDRSPLPCSNSSVSPVPGLPRQHPSADDATRWAQGAPALPGRRARVRSAAAAPASSSAARARRSTACSPRPSRADTPPAEHLLAEPLSFFASTTASTGAGTMSCSGSCERRKSQTPSRPFATSTLSSTPSNRRRNVTVAR